jgi:hypothetical protein
MAHSLKDCATGKFPSRFGGAVAQLGERLVRNEEVSGSIPLGSTTFQTFGRNHILIRTSRPYIDRNFCCDIRSGRQTHRFRH